jgi:DNA-directed RNA polymerase subunit M/transcription elongation factor TFIIS
MYIPKRYGETRIDSCPFCSKQALIKNPQGIAVCNAHRDKTLDNMKCACGEYLLIQEGKFGAFFNCLKCGNINLKKALEINSQLITKAIESEKIKSVQSQSSESVKQPVKKEYPRDPKKPTQTKEWIVRSDDPRYFDD